MKKSFILITLIAVLTASVALACAAGNYDCPYTGPTVWDIVYTTSKRYVCTSHDNCYIEEVWGHYGWKCPREECGYGMPDGLTELLLETRHIPTVR